MSVGKKIKFYGTGWCPGSRRAKKMLIQRGVAFEWINIDEDGAGREFVIQVNNGNRSVPTIVFPDGEILVEPSTTTLLEKLTRMALGTQ
jgi:mycoredoxin